MRRQPDAAYRPTMAPAQHTFLVETYVSHLDGATADDLSARLRAAIGELRREGLTLRWLRSFALVDDETYIWMVDAPDADLVALVHKRAAVSVDHIAAVTEVRGRSSPQRSSST